MLRSFWLYSYFAAVLLKCFCHRVRSWHRRCWLPPAVFLADINSKTGIDKPQPCCLSFCACFRHVCL